MPELPEVHTVKLSLEKNIINKKIKDVVMNYSNGLSDKAINRMFRKQSFDYIINNLKESVFINVERRGKNLIGIVDKNGESLFILVHLGMAGAWIYSENESDIVNKFRKHIHVKIIFDDNTILTYCDIRRQGGFSVHNYKEFKSIMEKKNLGPEPFQDNTMEIVLSTLRSNKWMNQNHKGNSDKKTIKAALMDQTVMAGTGNIYACEALFETKVNPYTKIWELSDEKIIEIFSKSRDLMCLSIKVGGTTFRDYVNGEGMTGGFQNYLKVYGKKTCPECSSNIISKIIAGRTTHWCPSCQQ